MTRGEIKRAIATHSTALTKAEMLASRKVGDRTSENPRDRTYMTYMALATLDEDEIDFEADSESKDCRSRKDVFNSMKNALNLENPQQNERFKEVTNMILEKLSTQNNLASLKEKPVLLMVSHIKVHKVRINSR